MVAFAKLQPRSPQEASPAAAPQPFDGFPRLADPEPAPRRPQRLLKIDRRVFPRKRLSLRVNGRRLDHSVEARREPWLHLSMNDVSVGGLCAVSQTSLKVGERVTVFFPPEAGHRGWDAYGRVLRVDPARQGFRVAVAFDPLPAA